MGAVATGSLVAGADEMGACALVGALTGAVVVVGSVATGALVAGADEMGAFALVGALTGAVIFVGATAGEFVI